MVKSGTIVILSVLACLMIVWPSAQAQKKPCDCAAIAVYDPVCGTDGRTYGNTGVLGCHNKCNNKKVKVRSRGPCRTG